MTHPSNEDKLIAELSATKQLLNITKALWEDAEKNIKTLEATIAIKSSDSAIEQANKIIQSFRNNMFQGHRDLYECDFLALQDDIAQALMRRTKFPNDREPVAEPENGEAVVVTAGETAITQEQLDRTLPELPEGWEIFDLNNFDCGDLKEWHCVLIRDRGLDNTIKVENAGDKTPRAAVQAAIDAIKESDNATE